MGPWWMYMLVFLFGYFTHKTFYFLRSLKLSIGLIRISQLFSLAILAKSMEHFYYAHTLRMRRMRENGDSEKEINLQRKTFNTELLELKEKAVQEILDLHPAFYDPIIDFDNWNSAMKYLNSNKQYMLDILSKDTDDKETT